MVESKVIYILISKPDDMLLSSRQALSNKTNGMENQRERDHVTSVEAVASY